MTITPEQAEQVKQQLLKQIENFPPEQRESAKERILEMSSEEIEELLKQNEKAMNSEAKAYKKEDSGKGMDCIFCSIVKGDTPSYKLDENKEAIAILDINPISKGHVLIVPKKHLSTEEKISNSTFSLAKKMSAKIKEKLKAKKVEISFMSPLNHSMIIALPVYNNETLTSPRRKADEKELKELQSLLEKKEKKKIEKIKKPKVKRLESDGKKLWLPKRIP